MFILYGIRPLVVQIKCIKVGIVSDVHGSEIAHLAGPVLPSNVGVAAHFNVKPVRAHPELSQYASKMSIAAALDVGFTLVARLEIFVGICSARVISVQLSCMCRSCRVNGECLGRGVLFRGYGHKEGA